MCGIRLRFFSVAVFKVLDELQIFRIFSGRVIGITGGNIPIITVKMAQFVHELGIEWHLMSATASMALVPCVVVTLFGQKYVVEGLRI